MDISNKLSDYNGFNKRNKSNLGHQLLCFCIDKFSSGIIKLKK